MKCEDDFCPNCHEELSVAIDGPACFCEEEAWCRACVEWKPCSCTKDES